MTTATDTQTVITLKGSVDIVSEFFFTAINSILYQRGEFSLLYSVDKISCSLINICSSSPGIYQPETFRREEKYGLTVLTTTDEGLLGYLDNIMSQVRAWLLTGDVQKFVVVVAGIDSGETLERWQFNVSPDNISVEKSADVNDENKPVINQVGKSSSSGMNKKCIKAIHNEIQAIIRQITASVTFLPLLSEPCAFDLLVYTNHDAAVPQKWYDSDPRYIMNSAEVKLRSFTTSVHKVDTMVTYREADEWEL